MWMCSIKIIDFTNFAQWRIPKPVGQHNRNGCQSFSWLREKSQLHPEPRPKRMSIAATVFNGLYELQRSG